MVLCWAGQSLLICVDRAMKAGINDAVSAIFQAVHKLRVLYRSAEPRNVPYNINNSNLMLVNFERVEFCGR